jgi:glycosyltransferase involved in cell wall biosynthesis
MARILVLSGIQLCTNPRVVKEADTLAEAGYEVEVVGATLEPQLSARDQALYKDKQWKYTVLFDAGSPALRDRVRSLAARARTRFWGEVFAISGITNPRQLGLLGPEMLKYALSKHFDLHVVHNPETLWVGVELLRRGRRVAIDVEDWYSEDLLPEDRRRYPVAAIRQWEAALLEDAAYATTTSKALSQALSYTYDCSPPAVMYNSFAWSDRNLIDGRVLDRVDSSIPSLCWFSQVTGAGRGLETLMDSLTRVNVQFEIHIRGTIRESYRQSLMARVPADWRTRIHFHPQVPERQLISRIAEHDVGLAAEIPFCRNKELTVSNKLPFYLLAGLAIVASDTPGQREVADIADGAVDLFSAGDASSLASALNRVFSNPDRLRKSRQRSLFWAERVFCWERSAPVLIEQVQRALDTTSFSQESRGRPESSDDVTEVATS